MGSNEPEGINFQLFFLQVMKNSLNWLLEANCLSKTSTLFLPPKNVSNVWKLIVWQALLINLIHITEASRWFGTFKTFSIFFPFGGGFYIESDTTCNWKVGKTANKSNLLKRFILSFELNQMHQWKILKSVEEEKCTTLDSQKATNPVRFSSSHITLRWELSRWKCSIFYFLDSGKWAQNDRQSASGSFLNLVWGNCGYSIKTLMFRF